ncbi:MAG: RNA polymerase subunit sigma-24 [Verrucomicrobia bacterium]|nr:MAG: RNA polymerase subunit sigma-24 [Verrucomicrobiota bacterium]PYL77647.1 MAG: RNA polymerase subunit sigma-24 [Verrucomicrobiota bacterium]
MRQRTGCEHRRGGNGQPSPGRFNTTRWSVVLSCADSGIESAAAHDALSELCKTYWRPIFAYICRRGHSIQDAEDLTQDFFASLLQGPLLQRADPERGRFRSLLLKALQDFLGHTSEKRDAHKRGGGVKFVSWDDWMAEAPSQLSISPQALSSWSPEQLFDLRWAATVVEQALRHLREECASKRRLRLFETLSLYLATDRADVSYHNLATTLGIAESAVKKQLHNLRRRYRWLICEEVAQTLENPSDVESEIRYLCATLAAGAEAA